MQSPVTKKTGTRSLQADCCAETQCNSGLRNNYFDGKRLSTHSFRAEQTYGLERRRLLNRAIHGWGVVYGYSIKLESKQGEAGKLSIGPGLALDQCGHELLQTSERTITFHDLLPIEQ